MNIPYNIFSAVFPKPPKSGKGTEFTKFIVSKASPNTRDTLLPMSFPPVSAHLTNVTFVYSDNREYELCGQMGHLIKHSGTGKAQLTHLVGAIMRGPREHDAGVYNRKLEWQRQVKTKGANTKKPEEPEEGILVPPADMTNPAFLKNAMACEKDGGRTQYVDVPEVEMTYRMFGGARMVSTMFRNIYDCGHAGSLRATADGVSGDPTLRVNITLSSTPEVARKFYKRDLTNGFFGRITFAYKGREERSGKIPKQGIYDQEYLDRLDQYLEKLQKAKGKFHVAPLNKVANQLAEEMAKIADMTDDDMLWELSHRCILSAWKKGAVLWLLNDQTWTRSIGEFVVWFCYYDLWSKIRVFGDMFANGGGSSEASEKKGPKNMLSDLPDSFNEQQLEALRLDAGKTREGTKDQLRVWRNRKFITYSAQTGLYTKTEEYLKGK